MTRRGSGHTLTTIGAAIFAALFLCATMLQAQQDDHVSLRHDDGRPFLSGRFIAYDGAVLTLATDHGVLSVRLAGLVCEGAGCPDRPGFAPQLRLAGARPMADLLMPALITAYARDTGATLVEDEAGGFTLSDDTGVRLRLVVSPSDTSTGFARLVAAEADVLLAARELHEAELHAARVAGLGQLDRRDRGLILALDGMVPISAPGHDIAPLSLLDLADILAGDLTDWSELGQPAGPIRLHLPSTGDGQIEGVIDRLLSAEGRELRADAVHHDGARAVAAAVASDDLALGVVPARRVGPAEPIALGGSCGLTLLPRPLALRTEDYPLTLPMILYTPQRRLHPEAERFLDWLRQPSAQLVVRRAGFVDQAAVTIPLGAQGDRLAHAIAVAGTDVPLEELQRLVDALRGRERLTATFRFEAGSTRLDAPSRANVMQLAQAIHDGRFRGKSLILVGFSDASGPMTANRDLSRARAETVRREVLSALGEALPERVALMVDAFGEALPVACDDTIWGQQANRRVELWVGDLP